jgi:hypothetical protein
VQPVAAAIADSIGLNDQPQLIDTRGWQMTTESTAPFLSITRDDLIQWGVMLGAGEVGVLNQTCKGRTHDSVCYGDDSEVSVQPF